MKVNGDAIYGTTYGPLQNLGFARTTAKGKTVYLHVFDWPGESIRVEGLTAKVAGVTLLNGNRPVKFSQSGAAVNLSAPGITPDPNATVFAIETQ
jgi:alpha-L-fucosidase